MCYFFLLFFFLHQCELSIFGFLVKQSETFQDVTLGMFLGMLIISSGEKKITILNNIEDLQCSVSALISITCL